ncbi:unnamed protein product [Meganyctiphanes norvegica]|uniref:Uncharacterized protein n=1 Tax=Meganyctiphanes norvegica TaxID=48144 RepID=A0AAV2RW95_MEGNR
MGEVDEEFVGERVRVCLFLLSSLEMLAADGKSGESLEALFMHLPPLCPPLDRWFLQLGRWIERFFSSSVGSFGGLVMMVGNALNGGGSASEFVDVVGDLNRRSSCELVRDGG